MTISYRDVRDGVAAISLSGQMTIGSTDAAIQVLVEDLLRRGKRTIIFDLAHVTALDSTGVGHFKLRAITRSRPLGLECASQGRVGESSLPFRPVNSIRFSRFTRRSEMLPPRILRGGTNVRFPDVGVQRAVPLIVDG
jgi:hypothetical protein